MLSLGLEIKKKMEYLKKNNSIRKQLFYDG